MKLIISFWLMLTCFSLLAQNSEIRNREFSLSLGAFENYMETLPNTTNLDFLNYFDTFPGFIDDVVVNLVFRFDFLSKMSANINLIVMSDLVPDNYDISAYYHFNRTVGVGLGSSLRKFYISHFEQFQLQSLPDYYLVDENQQQFKVYDLGFYVSPMINLIQSDRFQTTVKFNVGVSSFLNEEVAFIHKRKLSNERVRYHYDTKISFQPFVEPKLEMRLRAFDINEASVGLLLNTNFYYSHRNMNYNRSIQRWTYDNATNELIRTPKHLYSRFETEIGVYVKW